MRYTLDLAPRGIGIWGNVVGILTALCLAAAFTIWLALRPPRKWLSRFFVGLGVFLSISIAFGCFHHSMFQVNPDNFKLNAAIDLSKAFVPIEKQQELLEKISVSKEILAWILAGLNTPDGESRLKRIAKDISGDVKTTYVGVLRLAVVGSPQPLTVGDADAISLLEQNAPEQMRKEIEAQQDAIKTRPGIISPIPAWDETMGIPLEHLVNMKLFVQAVLGGRRPALSSPGSLESYSGKSNEKLRSYIVQDLGEQIAEGDSVDIWRAMDQIGVHEVALRSALIVATSDRDRSIDFQYFSLMTITLVGYGDILPNSTTARAGVCCEILVGTALLGFILSRLFEKVGAAARQP